MPVFFSIIIPTYNRSALLQSTLLSLVNQAYSNFEILVIDDGGTDNTQGMVDALNDSRIRYFWKENAERGAARNYGAARASGTYLNFFDSDDIAYPNHLQVAVEYLNAHPEAVVFHTSYDWSDIQLKKIRPPAVHTGELNSRVFKGNILSLNNMFLRKAEFDQLQFSEDRALSGTEDWLLWLQLCCRYKLTGIADITSSMIQHDSRSMTMATGNSTLNRARALKVHLENDACLKNNHSVYRSAMAEMYSLSALGFVLGKNKREAMACFSKAMSYRPGIIYTRRFLAIVKHLLN